LGPGPDIATVSAAAESNEDGTVTLNFAGDTLLGDQSQRLLDKNGYDWPFENVKGLLDADYFVANAEGPITRRTHRLSPTLDYSYNSMPQAAQALADAGVDGLGLANNHAMDKGAAGLADTMSYAQAAHLQTFGAGATPAGAAEPLLVTTDLGNVAVVGMGEDFGELMRVSDTHPGMTVMRDDRIRSAYFNAKAAGADYVIAYVHWGDNYQPVNQAQRGMAKLFAASGYDMVIGTGPHVAQPIEMVDGMPVVFSLGNFVFGTPGRWESYNAEGYGLVASLVLEETGATLELHCVVTDNSRVLYQPTACAPAEARRVLTGLSPDVTLTKDVGVLALPSFTHSA
jgi:poly-gamma-glutamate synthesis protein (capsule biosynthesis protein)